jgi:hypothetical protein
MSLISLQLLVLFFAFRFGPEHVAMSSADLNLPAGRILGAALSDDAKNIFVQQVAFSPEKAGRSNSITSRLRLSSWSIDGRSMTAQRDLDGLPPGSDSYPCGQMEVDSKLQRLITCSSGDHLDLFDSADLKTVGRIGSELDQTIYDFALDPTGHIIFVLSLHKDGALWLTSYSLLNGTQKQTTAVSSRSSFVRMSMALETNEGTIALGVTRANRSGDETEIYLCQQEPALACTSVAHVDPVSQMAFFGKQLLYVTLNFADRKQDCIMEVNTATGEKTRAYCSPATGVHYGMGVVTGKYIVGYTGTSKRGFFSEEIHTAKSTFSVWRGEGRDIAAVIEDPTPHGAFQNEIRIVTSSTGPVFAAYQRLSNTLRIYFIGPR